MTIYSSEQAISNLSHIKASQMRRLHEVAGGASGKDLFGKVRLVTGCWGV